MKSLFNTLFMMFNSRYQDASDHMTSSPFSQRGIGRMFYILKAGRIIKRFAASARGRGVRPGYKAESAGKFFLKLQKGVCHKEYPELLFICRFYQRLLVFPDFPVNPGLIGEDVSVERSKIFFNVRGLTDPVNRTAATWLVPAASSVLWHFNCFRVCSLLFNVSNHCLV